MKHWNSCVSNWNNFKLLILPDDVNKRDSVVNRGLDIRSACMIYLGIHIGNEKFDLKFMIKQLKEAFNNLKKDYQIVKELRNLSGFGWNDEKQVIAASQDVWENLFE